MSVGSVLSRDGAREHALPHGHALASGTNQGYPLVLGEYGDAQLLGLG